MSSRQATYAGIVVVATVICLMVIPERPQRFLLAQSTKSKSNVKALETRAEKATAGYLREINDVATAMEKAGEPEMAMQLLQTVGRISGLTPELRNKIQDLNEQVLSENQVELPVDISGGWGNPRAKVFAGKRFRVQAAGEYRFQAQLDVGPEGFATLDPTTDMVADVPWGALMGMVVVNGRPTKPFAIGKEADYTPKQDGFLFLRANLPPGHRSVGKIDVRIGGEIQTP